jgi:hypothetical protein
MVLVTVLALSRIWDSTVYLRELPYSVPVSRIQRNRHCIVYGVGAGL